MPRPRLTGFSIIKPITWPRKIHIANAVWSVSTSGNKNLVVVLGLAVEGMFSDPVEAAIFEQKLWLWDAV